MSEFAKLVARMRDEILAEEKMRPPLEEPLDLDEAGVAALRERRLTELAKYMAETELMRGSIFYHPHDTRQ